VQGIKNTAKEIIPQEIGPSNILQNVNWTV